MMDWTISDFSTTDEEFFLDNYFLRVARHDFETFELLFPPYFGRHYDNIMASQRRIF